MLYIYTPWFASLMPYFLHAMPLMPYATAMPFIYDVLLMREACAQRRA